MTTDDGWTSIETGSWVRNRAYRREQVSTVCKYPLSSRTIAANAIVSSYYRGMPAEAGAKAIRALR